MAGTSETHHRTAAPGPQTHGPQTHDTRTHDTKTHEPRICDASLARAFQFLGKRWNGVLLATLVTGPLGFSQLKRAVAGISDSVLSERLTELAGAGLVERSVQPGPPVTVTYELTSNGRALTPALQELTTWAAENLTDERCAAAKRKQEPTA